MVDIPFASAFIAHTVVNVARVWFADNPTDHASIDTLCLHDIGSTVGDRKSVYATLPRTSTSSLRLSMRVL